MNGLTQSEFDSSSGSIARQQSGVALIISMLLLAAMTMISVISMQNTVLEEKMSGNTRDRQLAFEAAEAAIRAGERYVQVTSFDNTQYTDTCTNGFCTRREDDANYDNEDGPLDANWVDQRWELDGSLDVWAEGSGRHRVYNVDFAESYKPPRYIIEFAGYIPIDPSTPTTTTPPEWYESPQVAGTAGWQAEWSEMYRITALGFGGTPNARVMLQTLYSKSL
jgi:type IV pilus assembly protein PilX